MAEAAVGDKPFRLLYRVLKALCPVHGEHGAQLLVRERLGKLDRPDFADEYLRALGYADAGKLRYPVRLLSDYLRVHRAVYDYDLAYLVGLLRAEEIAAAGGELRLDLIVDPVKRDAALLGCADHTVIKGLGVDNAVYREGEICALGDYSGGVSRSYADGGRAARISGVHHSGAARREDEIGLAHKGVRQLKAGHVDPADDILGCSGGYGCLENELCGGYSRLLRPRVRADDYAVSRFERDESLEYRRARRVRRGYYGGDNADGLGYLLYAVGLILFYNAAGLRVPVSVVDILGGKVVFYYLVLDHAHAGLLHRHLRKRYPRAVGGYGGGLEYLIYLFLRIGGELALRRPHPFKKGLEALGSVYDGVFHFFHKLILLWTADCGL